MDDKKKATIGLGLAAALGFYGFDSEAVLKFLGEAVQSQIAQAGFFFTFAAWLHAGRVKKEIAVQFQIVTEAINNVAVALRNDLASHAARLDRIEEAVFTTKKEYHDGNEFRPGDKTQS